jgi:glycosyltransferase involved in cell wall biosynthesis
MKIAFVYDAVHPWVVGGAQKRVWELARRLATNHEVHWYGQKYWEGESITKREEVTLHGVCEPKEFYVNERRSIKQALYFTANLIPALSRSDYDVIDCQEFPYFPCYVSRLSSLFGNSKLFITWYEVWGDYWFEYLGKMGYVGKTVERSVARLEGTHLATSNLTRRQLRSLGANDVRVSPLGIDFEQIESIAPVDRDIDVLFGGRLIPEKNAELIVEAIACINSRNESLNALIIGEGPNRNIVEKRIAELDLEDAVETMDFVEDEEFLRYMKASDIFAFPSQREGFGLVGLEALACGTPVVTSNHPQNAAQELIEPGQTGYTCDLNSEALASKLLLARSISSDGCRDFAQQYDWDRIATGMENYYEAALS